MQSLAGFYTGKSGTGYGEIIGRMADIFAYPINARAAGFRHGGPTEAYRSALLRYRSWHNKSEASRQGASCDVFVCTCVRASGYDPDFPSGLWKILSHLEASPRYYRVFVDEETIQNGDIIIYQKEGLPRRGHVCIYYNGRIKEASAGNYYGKTVDKVRERLSWEGKVFVHVYRAAE